MQKYTKELMLGGFILISGGLLAMMSLTIGKFQFGDSMRVRAVFSSASGIVKDAPVMLAGIEVGHVATLQVENNQAAMELVLKPDISLYADASAVIRSKSLLGEKFVMLKPGSAKQPPLRSGEAIKKTEVPVDLDEVLGHLGPVLTKINPEDINTLIHTIAASIKGKEGELRDLIQGSSVLLKTVSDNREAISRMIANLDITAQQAANLLTRNRGSLNNIVRNLDSVTANLRTDAPTTLRNVNRLTTDIRELTGPFRERAPQFAERLDQITTDAATLTRSFSNHSNLIPNLDSTLGKLPSLLDKAPATLDRLPPLIDKLMPTLDNANSMFGKLDKGFDKIDPILDKVGKLLDEKEIRRLLQQEGVKVFMEDIKVRLW